MNHFTSFRAEKWVRSAHGNSFDHLVGAGEKRGGHIEPEQLRHLQIDHQLELCRLHNGQIRRLCAFKNTSDVNANLSVCVRQAGSVANQAAAGDEFAREVNRGNCMACRKYDELICSGEEEWIARDEKRVDLLLGDGGERRVDFVAGASVQDMDRALKCLSRLLHIFQLERTSRKVWIYEHADHGRSGDQLVEQPKALSL